MQSVILNATPIQRIGGITGKCQSCGAEDVPLQNSSLGTTAVEVCARCYASIEKEYYERLKRKRGLI